MLLRTRGGTATVGAPAATARPAGREAPQPAADMAKAKAATVTATMTVSARAGTGRDYTQSWTLQGREPRRTLY